MADNMIYFGNRERMTWVRAPDANYDGSRVGWDGNVTQYLNGGVNVRRSTAAHRTYNYSWNMMSRDEIRNIMDYADGMYGNGAIYFIDPFAADKNLFPQHWAIPRIGVEDGISLGGIVVPSYTYITYANDLGYPTTGALYSQFPGTDAPRFYLPIPPGYTAWLGIHGDTQNFGSGAPFTVTPNGGTPGTVPLLGVTNPIKYNRSYAGNTYSGISIQLTGVGAINGMMLTLLKDGVTPGTGRFVSGQGHGGVHFVAQPSLTQYSKALDKVSLSAQFVEDEPWR